LVRFGGAFHTGSIETRFDWLANPDRAFFGDARKYPPSLSLSFL